jgi:hypothetical protein
MRGRDNAGRVEKNSDGSFTGIMGRVRVNGNGWDDAMHQVVAEVDGLAISDLVKVIPFRPVQEHTNAILDWLANNAEANTGHPQFKNEDLAHIIGWDNGWGRAVGNLVSRLDFCCYKIGLPSIGCAAETVFPNAWHSSDPSWDYPLDRMKRRAGTHRWSHGDFERLKRESMAMAIGTGHLAWKDEEAKHWAKIRNWTETE